ncbi:hypothetical protein SESBI_36277 [Sesbania bispinosa]|nr:hypothetical protein SESBI_36277 [Sesbania bispinosa]
MVKTPAPSAFPPPCSVPFNRPPPSLIALFPPFTPFSVDVSFPPLWSTFRSVRSLRRRFVPSVPFVLLTVAEVSFPPFPPFC